MFWVLFLTSVPVPWWVFPWPCCRVFITPNLCPSVWCYRWCNRSYWSMCVGFLSEKNVRQRSNKSILGKSFCHSMSLSCTRLKCSWNSTAAAANLGWPKLLFIVQSTKQFQIKVIAKLSAVRYFYSDAKQWKLSSKLACKLVLPFYKKTKIKRDLERRNDSYMTFITTRH